MKKYLKFTRLSRLLLFAFTILIAIGAFREEITGVICGILGIISVLISALFTKMYDLTQMEIRRKEKIIHYLQLHTGLWN